MPHLSIEEIYAAAREAGFDQQQAVTFTAIAMAESGGDTGALNSKGEYSVGLWQINVNADPGRATRWGADLHDAKTNAKAAYAISDHGKDMSPWTTTHDRNKNTNADYRTYLGDVEETIGIKGDGRGVTGYGAKPLPPLPVEGEEKVSTGGSAADTVGAASASSGSGFDMPRGRSMTSLLDRATSTTDRDHDGLTDAFERIAGTKIKDDDTDRDGLTDGYEATVSHTDPLTADTDNDNIDDAKELADHTDTGTVKGTAGVIGTGLLAQNAERPEHDTDQDGLADRVEKLIGTKIDNNDTDDDGLTDNLETAYGTNPLDADTDRDGLTDGFEVQHDLNALAAGSSQENTVEAWTAEQAVADRQAEQATAEAAAAARAAQVTTASTTTSTTTPSTGDGSGGALDAFMSAARDQLGDQYVYGAQLRPKMENPTQFDCSSFTAWAAAQAGVELPRTAEEQYRFLKERGMLIKTDDAMHTKGALLFYFTTEPKGQLSAGNAHVAISDGKGGSIEAKNSSEGVVTEDGVRDRFNFAAVIPGISDPETAKAALSQPAPTTTGAATAPTTSVVDTGADGSTVSALSSYAMPQGRSLSAASPGSGKDAASLDRDHDGLTDAFERIAGTKIKDDDTDRDGLTDGYEATVSHTDPLTADTDNDNIDDAKELADHTDTGTVKGTAGVIGTGLLAQNAERPEHDTDQDGLADRVEKLIGTKIDNNDTDDDGLTDNLETAYGTNPLEGDTDRDGLSDYLEVQSDLEPLAAGSVLGGTGTTGIGDGAGTGGAGVAGGGLGDGAETDGGSAGADAEDLG